MTRKNPLPIPFQSLRVELLFRRVTLTTTPKGSQGTGAFLLQVQTCHVTRLGQQVEGTGRRNGYRWRETVPFKGTRNEERYSL